MFEVTADICSIDTMCVVPVRSFDMMYLRERLSQVSADKVLVPEFSAKGCATSSPVEIAAQVHAIDIRTVIVVFHLGGLSAIAFVAVTVLVPVDTRGEVETTALGTGLDSRIDFRGMLILIVGLPFG